MKAVAPVLLIALAACSNGAAKTQAQTSEDVFPKIFKTLRPSVVLFTMLAPSDDPKKKNVYDDAYGTGFVVESGAWGSRFLTAEHVIDGARRLRVTIVAEPANSVRRKLCSASERKRSDGGE